MSGSVLSALPLVILFHSQQQPHEVDTHLIPILQERKRRLLQIPYLVDLSRIGTQDV